MPKYAYANILIKILNLTLNIMFVSSYVRILA